jgi:UDP-N-acetylmuramoyl-tripeptide--D-alanyl-D-alanine ligase
VPVRSTLPSIAISYLATLNTLKKAQRKLHAGSPKIIGVGGSYGKTSTKHLLHHFLSQKFSVFVTPKSFNNKLSVAQSILKGYTNQEIALLEYGAYIKGEIAYLTKWFPPQLAVETGFTPQHLSLFGSRENSIVAESELIAALPEDGVVYCNGADPGAVEICKTGATKNQAKIVMYSGQDAKIALSAVSLSERGHLRAVWKGHTLETQLVGRQYLVNLQAAMLIASDLGVDDVQIVAAAKSFDPNDSFIQSRQLTSGALFIDDGGTSNPMGFAAALELLRELPQPKKILVTAGMIDLGAESRQIHLQLAKRAKELGIIVAHVGIDGRDEFVEVFEQELVTDVSATEVLLSHLSDDAVVLLEGKVPKALEHTIKKLHKEDV